jgi:hypothetical protein
MEALAHLCVISVLKEEKDGPDCRQRLICVLVVCLPCVCASLVLIVLESQELV